MLWEVRIDARETVKRVKPLLSSVHCDCDGVTLPACLSACIKAHKATRRRKSNRNEFESIWQAEIIPFTFNPISTYINVNKIKFSANELHDNKYTHSEPCNSDFGVFANIILFLTIFVHLFFFNFLHSNSEHVSNAKVFKCRKNSFTKASILLASPPLKFQTCPRMEIINSFIEILICCEATEKKLNNLGLISFLTHAKI